MFCLTLHTFTDTHVSIQQLWFISSSQHIFHKFKPCVYFLVEIWLFAGNDDITVTLSCITLRFIYHQFDILKHSVSYRRTPSLLIITG